MGKSLVQIYQEQRARTAKGTTPSGAAKVDTSFGTLTITAHRIDGNLVGFNLGGFGRPRFVTTGILAALLENPGEVTRAAERSAEATDRGTGSAPKTKGQKG